MSRNRKALSVLVVSFLGLWGCAQGPSNSSAQADRVKKLEEKCSRLEEDYRTKAVAHDQARKQAAVLDQEKTQLEEQRARMQKELDQLRLVVKERDRLRQEVEVKTTQRDALLANRDKMRNIIKSLKEVSEDDTMMNAQSGTTTLGSDGQ
jgi:hypothetical protein